MPFLFGQQSFGSWLWSLLPFTGNQSTNNKVVNQDKQVIATDNALPSLTIRKRMNDK